MPAQWTTIGAASGIPDRPAVKPAFQAAFWLSDWPAQREAFGTTGRGPYFAALWSAVCEAYRPTVRVADRSAFEPTNSKALFAAF